MTERAEYDAIGDRYSEAKTAPWRIHLEAYTVEKLIGRQPGMRVLDLACGDGFYGRRMIALGAAEVVGVDLSEEMVALGRRTEAHNPIGCRYRVGDVMELGVIGEFDIAIAAFLLNYASNRDDLRRFCDVIYANLRPGGRVVGVNDYTDDTVTGVRAFDRHGFHKIGPQPYAEGEPITYEFLLPGARSFAITNYYWRPQTYVRVMEEAGLLQPTWQPFQVSPDSRGAYPPDFWSDLLAAGPMAAFHARR